MLRLVRHFPLMDFVTVCGKSLKFAGCLARNVKNPDSCPGSHPILCFASGYFFVDVRRVAVDFRDAAGVRLARLRGALLARLLLAAVLRLALARLRLVPPVKPCVLFPLPLRGIFAPDSRAVSSAAATACFCACLRLLGRERPTFPERS